MKIPRKNDYAVRALIDLAQHYGEGAILSGDIAARQGIPEPYLDHLLLSLRKAGLVVSRRGPQGGHMLSKPPAQIDLSEVIAALEGSPASPDCGEESRPCAYSPSCALRDVWQEVDAAADKVLRATTIATLAQCQRRREQKGTYYI